MFDIIMRPKSPNTQVAGTVNDTSHQVGRQSQETKLPESLASQKIFAQESRWKESKGSSQDNERQEIKPSIEQPVLNPKYSSIQSISDLGLPSDQIFKCQDAHDSAKLSTMKSVNPKKIQENPPQKTRSNQEIPQQTVDPQKVDPQKANPQQVECRKVGPQNVDYQQVERQKVDSQKIGPQRVEPQKDDRQKVNPHKADSRKADSQKVDHQVERQKVDAQKIGPQKIESQKPDSQRACLQEVEHQEVEHQKVDPHKAEPHRADLQQANPQQVDPQKVDPHGAEPQKADLQQANPQQVDLQQADPQKVDPQKVDRQKVDCQKAENVDPYEGGHTLTPFHSSDYSTSIRSKSQETKSDRYTHDQGAYTAQSHKNIIDQNSAKTDSLGQHALDSELPLAQQSLKLPEDKVDKQVSSGSKGIQRILNRQYKQKTNYGKSAPKPKKKGIGRPLNFWKEALAKQVKTEELSQDDVIIAVMGPTGSGKSTFIEIATGFGTGVGHNLESCTSEINIVKLSLPELADGDVVFVDTPGFDDTHKSDVEILKMVADWLKTTYEKEILLSGLLYFHRISDNRMAGTPLKNLRMFEELCGKNALHNVILVTTMWDEVDEETGDLREKELKSKYWRSMLDYNSTTSRFMHTRESALRLIEPFVEAANDKSSVLLQQEMVDMRTKLPATSAGVRVFSEMEDLVKRRQEVLKQIRNAMKQAKEDQQSLSVLQEEYQRIKMQFDATVNEMRQLKLPLGKRLSGMTRKWFSFKISF